MGDSYKLSLVLVAFFIPYILFEIPSNLLIKKFTPNLWLGGLIFMFGLTTLLQGFVSNFVSLLVLRFFLGVFEAGLFPGAFYIIGMWYRRSEAQKRYTFYFSSTSLAGAFGGLLSYALGKLHGTYNKSGWRWIFIVEGSFTMFISLFLVFFLPKFPDQVNWLTPDEQRLVRDRIRTDHGSDTLEATRPSMRDVLLVFKDPLIILGGLMYLGLVVPLYCYAYFSPAIIQSFGFDPIKTQLYGVPPWIVAFILGMIVAYLSDKAGHRFYFIGGLLMFGFIGLVVLLITHSNRNLEYGMLFFILSGVSSAFPIIVCWFNMNLGGHLRRSIGAAWQVGFGNLGGIIAAFSFFQSESPRYYRGYSICLGFLILTLVSCLGYYCVCSSRNQFRRNIRANLSSIKNKSSVDKMNQAINDQDLEDTRHNDLNINYTYLL